MPKSMLRFVIVGIVTLTTCNPPFCNAQEDPAPRDGFLLNYTESRFARSFTVLSKSHSVSLTGIREYRHSEVHQGAFQTGPSQEDFVSFVLAQGSDRAEKELYIDLNRNRDLSDDPCFNFLPLHVEEIDFGDIYIESAMSGVVRRYKIGLEAYGSEPARYKVYFYSGWQGTVDLDGKRYRIAVVDNLDGEIDENDLMIIGAGWSRDTDLASSIEAFRFPAPATLFINGTNYKVVYWFVNEVSGTCLNIDFIETPVAMGKALLGGTGISRLVLEKKGDRKKAPVILDSPGPDLMIPEGLYDRQRIYLDGGEYSGPLYAECEREILVEKESSVTVALGGPLDNTAEIKRGGNTLVWKCLLVGIGGETYYEFVRFHGKQAKALKEDGGSGGYMPTNPPLTRLYFGESCISSFERKDSGEVIVLNDDIEFEESIFDWDDGKGEVEFWGAPKEGDSEYKITIADQMISYYHERVASYSYGIEPQYRWHSWPIPRSVIGDIKLVVSRDIGDLGPDVGQPVICHWNAVMATLRIGSWILLLPLLLLRTNRNKVAVTAVLLVLLMQSGLFLCSSMYDSDSLTAKIIETLAAFPLGFGALFLLSGILGRSGGLTSFGVALVIMLNAGIIGFFFCKGFALPLGDDGWYPEIVTVCTFLIWSLASVTGIAIAGNTAIEGDSVKMPSLGFCIRHALAFGFFSALIYFPFALTSLGLFAQFNFDNDPVKPFVILLGIYGIVVSAVVFVMNLPFILLFLRSKNYKPHAVRIFGSASSEQSAQSGE